MHPIAVDISLWYCWTSLLFLCRATDEPRLRAAAMYSSAADSSITDRSAGSAFCDSCAGAVFVGEVSWCDGGRGITTLG